MTRTKIVSHRLFRLAWIPSLAWVALLAACAISTRLPDSDRTALDRLVTLIDARLAIGEEVARTKWNSGAAVEDPPREQQVLDSVVSRAAEFGLGEAWLRDFFRAQIEANKAVQLSLHTDWRRDSQPKFAAVADLGRDIRPRLDTLTGDMLDALRAAEPVLGRRGVAAAVDDAASRREMARKYPDAARIALQPLLARSVSR